MKIEDFKNIEVDWKTFDGMSDFQKSKALQNLLATLSASDYNLACALLSLHASGLLDIDFREEEDDASWDYWTELIKESLRNKEREEEDY